MKIPEACPKCKQSNLSRAGLVRGRQRWKCSTCHYHFTVEKIGKQIDSNLVTKALQLYLEGLSYREIERILGVSHVSVSNWVKMHGIKQPKHIPYRPTYKILSREELHHFVLQWTSKPKASRPQQGFLITEIGDKFMLIQWPKATLEKIPEI